MKQIDECLTREFSGKPSLKRKWRAFLGTNPKTHCRMLLLYHYHHLILRYDVDHHVVLYEWWEKPADKRGLDSAKEWLGERQRKLKEKQE
ncbi:hypothetical protein LAV82_23625 [Bacillus sp. ILBB4]|nr:hypothetical protein [Bacillus sp. ILBB4]